MYWVEWVEVTGHDAANAGREEDGLEERTGVQTVVLSSLLGCG